ncbi:hypothetical protein [Neoasaia chiangmaiensis]|uniref:hypothetical protein n=2 Tax=Neoasaia chiangmaiensis TaxID=320497 RepID=UPI001FE7C24B|nr:hypothetical protein [Neoasaia chiangmaiensis]
MKRRSTGSSRSQSASETVCGSRHPYSLLHVSVDLTGEEKMDAEIRSWLAFAVQKLSEIKVLAIALRQGRSAVADELADNRIALDSRRNSPRVNNPDCGLKTRQWSEVIPALTNIVSAARELRKQSG